MTTVVVTGASGYVGGRLIEHLSSIGITVRAAVRRFVPWIETQQVVVDLARGDLGELLDGSDCIVHLAGANEVQAADDPNGTTAATVAATRALARGADAKRFIYLSTFHVYGRPASGAVITEETSTDPQHPYSRARLASEEAARAELDPIVLRLTNSVGAPAHPSVNRWTLVANDLCRQAIVDGKLLLASDGTAWRDFVSLTDVCEIVADIATRDESMHGTYNIGSGTSTTIRRLAEVVQDLAPGSPPIEGPTAQDPPTEPYRVSVDKLAAAGYRPARTLENAIEETLRFCSDHKDELDHE